MNTSRAPYWTTFIGNESDGPRIPDVAVASALAKVRQVSCDYEEEVESISAATKRNLQEYAHWIEDAYTSRGGVDWEGLSR